jgi:mannose-1-phosphate guanylyltransferase
VRRFVEKPDAASAHSYVESGRFGWNSGMFIFGAPEFLAALRRFKPESHEGIARIGEAWDTPRRDSVLGSVYPALPRISVDYAIMEPATRAGDPPVITIDMQCRWMDVGGWTSLAETLPADANGNRTSGGTAVTHLDSRNVVVVSDDPNQVITSIGCHDLIIVHTAGATLVCPAAEAERVKEPSPPPRRRRRASRSRSRRSRSSRPAGPKPT